MHLLFVCVPMEFLWAELFKNLKFQFSPYKRPLRFLSAGKFPNRYLVVEYLMELMFKRSDDIECVKAICAGVVCLIACTAAERKFLVFKFKKSARAHAT
mmetsp:Transcript_1771/g.2875  ORF Transcript_1771/g.2875 Transcript_1771/m.2875 type:complete len:99 (-) Transcript_1771:306-602(-)